MDVKEAMEVREAEMVLKVTIRSCNLDGFGADYDKNAIKEVAEAVLREAGAETDGLRADFIRTNYDEIVVEFSEMLYVA